MAAFVEKHRKPIFCMILAAAFLTIYVYNILTPYLSDDYAYAIHVREASSFYTNIDTLSLHDALPILMCACLWLWISRCLMW